MKNLKIIFFHYNHRKTQLQKTQKIKIKNFYKVQNKQNKKMQNYKMTLIKFKIN